MTTPSKAASPQHPNSTRRKSFPWGNDAGLIRLSAAIKGAILVPLKMRWIVIITASSKSPWVKFYEFSNFF